MAKIASKKKGHIIFLLFFLIIAPIFLGFGIFEIYHRIKLNEKILDMLENGSLWIQNHTLTRSAVDNFFNRSTEELPKGLFKINTTFDVSVVHPTNGTLNFSVRSNNLGLLSDKEYNFERDPRKPEYRIVVLGDSMTGPTTSTYQWVYTLEDLLNSQKALKDSVGGQFKVYNLGWVGAGFQTFWNAYEKSGKLFSPDLLVVNYIEIDFPRAKGPHLKDESEMLEHARSFLMKLFNAHPNVLVTLMPVYGDMIPELVPFQLTEKLIAREPSIQVIEMRDHLPTQLGIAEIEKWFNVPHDAHYSDRGGEIYARALAGVIAKRITGKKWDFSDTRSKYGDEVLGPNAPKTRRIEHSIARIANDFRKVQNVKNYIRTKMLEGKIYSFYPYSLNTLFGMGTDGITIPYTKPVVGDFVRVPYGDAPEDIVYLNIVCTSKPRNLTNPECYHHFHMFTE